jgi:hypothetical protein
MRTIRGRLVVSYAAALAATVTVFGATIYLVQRSESFTELDARARLEADLVAGVLIGAARGRDSVVEVNPSTRRPDHLL